MSDLKTGDKAWVIQTPHCNTTMLGKLVVVEYIYRTPLLFCDRGPVLGCAIHKGTCANAGGKNHPIHWLKKHEPDGVNKEDVDALYSRKILHRVDSSFPNIDEKEHEKAKT